MPDWEEVDGVWQELGPGPLNSPDPREEQIEDLRRIGDHINDMLSRAPSSDPSSRSHTPSPWERDEQRFTERVSNLDPELRMIYDAFISKPESRPVSRYVAERYAGTDYKQRLPYFTEKVAYLDRLERQAERQRAAGQTPTAPSEHEPLMVAFEAVRDCIGLAFFIGLPILFIVAVIMTIVTS